MDCNHLNLLKNFAPSSRIRGYQTNKYGADPLKLYLWNMRLSESLYQSLCFLEITFRNALVGAIIKVFGLTEWPLEYELLADKEVSKVIKVIFELEKHKKEVTSDEIIAELTFGFWTSLLDKRYEQVLWPKIITKTFPFMPRETRTRKTLSKRFNRIRLLRNRVFHYEPIWHWKDLKQQYGELVEALMWLEPKASELLKQECRFLKVYNNPPSRVGQFSNLSERESMQHVDQEVESNIHF